MDSKILKNIKDSIQIPIINKIKDKTINCKGFFLLYFIENIESFIIMKKQIIHGFLKFSDKSSNREILDKFLEISKVLPKNSIIDQEKLYFSCTEFI